jgi:hypothetical protein
MEVSKQDQDQMNEELEEIWFDYCVSAVAYSAQHRDPFCVHPVAPVSWWIVRLPVRQVICSSRDSPIRPSISNDHNLRRGNSTQHWRRCGLRSVHVLSSFARRTFVQWRVTLINFVPLGRLLSRGSFSNDSRPPRGGASCWIIYAEHP